MTSTTRQPSALPKFYIAGMGMITPVGGNTATTAAALNAGISAYGESRFYNKNRKPITMAAVPALAFEQMDVEIDEGERYNEQQDNVIKMAIAAIGQACDEQPLEGPIPLVLAFPEMEAQADFISSSKLIQNLSHNCQPWIDPQLSRSLHNGRASGIEALSFAYEYLYEPYGDYVLIGGSDSYRHYSRLDLLDADDRLMVAGSQDSFAPGEAGCFLLLTKNPANAMARDGHIVALSQPGLAHEPGHMYNDEAYRGEGLASAFKETLDKHPTSDIHTIYSSMNGENFWAKELGVAQLRNKSAFRDPVAVRHPADGYGDLGAATAPALIALAATDLLERNEANTHLVYSSSDYGLRGAVLVNRQKVQQR